MKISKFNESVSQEWTDEKIKKVFADYSSFCSLVNEYADFKDDQKYFLQDLWWDFDSDEYLCICVEWSHHQQSKNIYFSKKEYYENIIPFINDPDTYKVSKRYNL